MTLYGKVVIIKRNGLDGSMFPLVTDSCLIGRGKNCDIRIQLATVSKIHCILYAKSDGQVMLTSVAENQHTLVNNRAVEKSVILKHEDIITVSERSFRFEYPPNSAHRSSVIPQENDSTLSIKDTLSAASPSLEATGRIGIETGKRSSSSSATDTPKRTDVSARTRTSLSPKGSSKRRRSSSNENAPPRTRTSRVSFGPELSPECFDASLPPATPIRRGSLPLCRASTPFPKDSFDGLASQKRRSRSSRIRLSSKTKIIVEAPNEGESSSKENSLPALPKSSPGRRPSPKTPKQTPPKGAVCEKMRSSVRLVKSEPHRLNRKVTIPVTRRGRSLSSSGLSGHGRSKSRAVSPKSAERNKRPNEITPKEKSEVKRSRSSSSADCTFPSRALKRRAVSKSPWGKAKTKGIPVPKIVSPSSPDSKKSAALLTIHASHLNSSKKKTRSQKKALPSTKKKRMWSEVLKEGLMKKGIKPVLGLRRQFARSITATKAKKRFPVTSTSVRSTRKNPLTSTGHANSPADIVIRKVKRSVKKGGSTSKKTPSKSKSSPINVRLSRSSSKKTELSGFESLQESPKNSPLLSSLQNSMQSPDLSNAVTPDISQEHFVSPLETGPRNNQSRQLWVRHFVKDLSPTDQAPSKKKSSSSTLKMPTYRPSLRSQGTLKDAQSPPKRRKSSESIHKQTHSSQTSGDKYGNVLGVKELFAMEKAVGDVSLSGLKRLLRTPKIKKSVKSISQKGTKLCHIKVEKFDDKLCTRSHGSPKLSPTSMQRLFKLPQASPKADYRNVKGMKRMFAERKEPDYTSPIGVKRLMRTSKSPTDSDVTCIRTVLRTPKTPYCDYRNLKGVRELMRAPKSPHSDYCNVSGVKQLFGKNSPELDYVDPEVLRKLFDAPAITTIPSPEPKSTGQVAKITAEPSNTGSRKISSAGSFHTLSPSPSIQNSSVTKKSRRKQTTSSPTILVHLPALSGKNSSPPSVSGTSLVFGNKHTTMSRATKNSPKALTLDKQSSSAISTNAKSPVEKGKDKIKEVTPQVVSPKLRTRRRAAGVEEVNIPVQTIRRRAQGVAPETPLSVASIMGTPSELVEQEKGRRGRKRNPPEGNVLERGYSVAPDDVKKPTRGKHKPSAETPSSKLLAMAGTDASPASISKSRKTRRGQKQQRAENDAKSNVETHTAVRTGAGDLSPAVAKASSPKTSNTPLRSGRRRKAAVSPAQNVIDGNSASRATRSRRQLQPKVTKLDGNKAPDSFQMKSEQSASPVSSPSKVAKEAGTSVEQPKKRSTRKATKDSYQDKKSTPSLPGESRHTRRQWEALQESSLQTVRDSPSFADSGAINGDLRKTKRTRGIKMVSPERTVKKDPSEKENIEVSPPRTRKRTLKKDVGTPSSTKKSRKNESLSPATRSATTRVLRSRAKK